jgi:hypothetical protein
MSRLRLYQATEHRTTDLRSGVSHPTDMTSLRHASIVFLPRAVVAGYQFPASIGAPLRAQKTDTNAKIRSGHGTLGSAHEASIEARTPIVRFVRHVLWRSYATQVPFGDIKSEL